MKQKFRMFRRGAVFYVEHTDTGKQESLKTRDRAKAARLLAARNEAHQHAGMNLQIARVYLLGADPQIGKRTWQNVMHAVEQTKHGDTLLRWQRGMREKPFDLIRDLPVLGTQSELFLKVLSSGTVSTNIFLRRLHNFALDMNWLPAPIIPRRQWPAIRFKEKRAITWLEHQKILADERNPEWRAYYELLWHLGASQTDVAMLSAEDVDWSMRVVAFARGKTGSPVQLHFGDALAGILKTLPKEGPLFPMISKWHEKDRAKAFTRRCKRVEVSGVTLHGYRYSWAERAKSAGYPERFAQQALGHGSKAVARAYAKKAQVKLPSLEEYERQVIRLSQKTAA